MTDFSPQISTLQCDANIEVFKKVDYSNLPCPVPYDQIHREAIISLRLDLFEGFRFDYNKAMNQKLFLTHSFLLGPTEVAVQPYDIIKFPVSNYECAATFIHQNFLLTGNLTSDGTLHARVKWDLTDSFSIKTNAQLTNEQDMLHGGFIFDYKGSDYRTQLQLGPGSVVGANYIQHVSPHLSLGSQVFWNGQHLQSGVNSAARYETDKMFASAQVASSGMVIMNYVHKVSEKVSLATNFMYNYLSRDVTASVGYDHILRQSRFRGKIDSNGVVATLLEENMFPGLKFLLSSEVDYLQKDYKFGFGFILG